MSERVGATTGSPVRVQLRRSRGWRIPPNTVVVSRPSRWGNPFRLADGFERTAAVASFRAALLGGELAFTVSDVRRELGGFNLACWCPIGEACHADVLLELANSPD